MRKLRVFTKLVVVLWILSQVIIVLTLNDMLQWPDSARTYIPQAIWHYQSGTFYPTEHNLYDNFIQAIGYINFLVLMLNLFGSFIVVMFSNVLMNIGVICCIYYLANRFFNESVACISVILYCLILSNVFMPLYIMSDLPSLFFSLVGFCLLLNKRWYIVLIGSLFLGVAHTIRSYEMAFLIPTLIYYIIHKVSWKKYLILVLPYCCIICMAGFYSKSQTNEFVTCSTTNGFASIKVALGDGKTDAGNNIFVDKSSPIYQGLPGSYTFAQKDSIWKERARPGIKRNLVKHILYWPYRIYKMYQLDTFFIPSTARFNKANISDEERKASIIHKLYQLGWIWNNFVYIAVIIMFFMSLLLNRNFLMSEKGLLLLVLLIMSCGLTLVIAEERYHYPCVFLLCIWAAYGVDTMLKKRKRKLLFEQK